MTSLRRSLAALCALVLALASCTSSDLEASTANAGAVNSNAANLHVTGRALAGSGDLWLIAVSEADQGLDLDGDGDELDIVVATYDVPSGKLENLGLAVAGSPRADARFVDEGRAAFLVDEAAQGLDLDGDGDQLDLVLHLFDVRKASVENVGLCVLGAPFALRLEGGLLSFAADEDAQGADLDGDGRIGGEDAFVRDFTRGTTANLRRLLGSSALHAVDRRAAFLPMESLFSGDLNGDGDVLDDAVLTLYDGPRGFLVDGGLATDGSGSSFAGGFVTVRVSEADQRIDANGDGDLLDLVYFDFDPISGITRNLGIECANGPAIEGPDVLALLALEGPTSGDLNGDGDTVDVVPFLDEPLRGRLTNLGLAEASGTAPLFLDRSLVVIVSEAEQGQQDLDNDGDALDLVPFVFDLQNGTLTNVGVEGRFFRAAGTRLLFARLEFQAGVDWNGDGDMHDAVLFAWDEATGQVVNTHLGAVGLLDARGARVLVLQSEAGESSDLNADGDELDLVVASFDFATGQPSRTALASTRAALLSEDEALVLVDEGPQGLDLDGDGDLADAVLHRVVFAR